MKDKIMDTRILKRLEEDFTDESNQPAMTRQQHARAAGEIGLKGDNEHV